MLKGHCTKIHTWIKKSSEAVILIYRVNTQLCFPEADESLLPKWSRSQLKALTCRIYAVKTNVV